MRAQFVNESYIKFSRSSQDLQREYPIFRNASTAYILMALQKATDNQFSYNKLDLDKFYAFLKGPGSMYKYKGSFEDMKQTLMDIAPVLGIQDQIKFNRKDKSEMKLQQKALSGELPLDFFYDAEIPEEAKRDDDYVVRNRYGTTEPAFYRFGRKLSIHESNLLRSAYALSHSDPNKTAWTNYLEAVPARVGFVKRNNRSFEKTDNIS